MRHLLILSLLLCAASSAMAITFQPRLEKAEWAIAGDQFECRLSQAVTGFGSGVFVRRAGERVVFRLESNGQPIERGNALLLAAAAPWRPTQGDINLGLVTVSEGQTPFSSNNLQAERLLVGLLDGRSPLVRLRTAGGHENMEVRLLPTHFAKAYDDYQACTAKLLPVNFDQVRLAQIGFPDGGDALDPMARAKLDIIVQLLKADPSINHISLDGHSDNTGNRLDNRELSRRRAMSVRDYLIAAGIPESEVVVRFHGERYPLVPNNSAANRAKNRRVTLQLERNNPQQQAEPEEAPPAPTAAPAATPPAPPPPAPAPGVQADAGKPAEA